MYVYCRASLVLLVFLIALKLEETSCVYLQTYNSYVEKRSKAWLKLLLNRIKLKKLRVSNRPLLEQYFGIIKGFDPTRSVRTMFHQSSGGTLWNSSYSFSIKVLLAAVPSTQESLKKEF